jgi:deoxyribodipyrimidine photo-lyase
MWFRSDLRTDDNVALCSACESEEVVALFVLTPDEWQRHEVAPVRVDFMLRTLVHLREALGRINIPLKVITSPQAEQTAGLVVSWARQWGCGRILANREYEVNESARDARVRQLAHDCGIHVSFETDQVIIDPASVRTGEGRYYTVFSPFKRSWIKRVVEEGEPRCRPCPAPRRPIELASDQVPQTLPGFQNKVDPSLWEAGEVAATRRLRAFAIERMKDYKQRRDLPGEDGTSRLSPYLAVGSVSPRRCLEAALKVNAASSSPLEKGQEGALTWISEICWREFYVHVLVGFPRVCKGRAFQPVTERLVWNDNPDHFEAWKDGRTGVPIVDAGMRQLRTEGWMHNRVRMITAMFLTKNLFIDWRLGEAHFMRNLIDGFLASNNGGWQWSASTGTDAAPYFRIFNPVSQGQKFDPDGAYVRRFVPEVAEIEGEMIHEPWNLPALARQFIRYPDPIVDLSESRETAISRFKALKE